MALVTTDIFKTNLIKTDKGISLFQGLNEDTFKGVLEHSTLHDYDANQTIIQQGDTPSNLYYIIEGGVRTFRANEDGDEATIRMLSNGDTCMEAVIFMGIPSPINVQSISESRILHIPANYVKNLTLKDTQFANNLLKIVTHHYKNALQQIDAMAIKSPVERVGYYFLGQHLEQGANSMDFELPFKKAIIASHLGMTPETFSRSLSQIKKMGIEIKSNKIRLEDAFALCHFCDLDIAHQCTVENKDDCPNCPINESNKF